MKRKLTSLNLSKNILEKEKKDLNWKCKTQSDTLTIFAKSKQELHKLLSLSQKPSEKDGIDNKQNTFLKKNQTTFIKAKGYWYGSICSYCGKKGHIKFGCPYQPSYY